jgi:TrpR-related protein YerC/YecD
MDHDHHLTVGPTEDLFDAILLLKTKDEAQRFFKDLCTPQEFAALHERWRICRLLQPGNLSYRQIHELTGSSLATIVRVARFLKDEPFQGYQLLLDRINRKKARGRKK